MRFRVVLLGFTAVLNAYGAVIVQGNNTPVSVTGTGGLSAIAIGYDSTNGAIQSTFSTNFLVKGDGVGSSSPLNFSSAPYTSSGASLYFVFVLDSQETNGNELLSIDLVELLVNDTVIWASTQAITLNPGTPLTLTPLGNGADMALYVPVAAFNGLGLTGSDTFVFRATHSQSNNGNEEWRFTDRGITTPLAQFASNAAIVDPGAAVDIPEPGSMAMTAIGAGLLFLVMRRR